jgi:hypothetical protein
MRLTNAPTNALRRTTNALTDAYANAPTNDANALRTRPPIPPYALAPSRAASGTARAARIRTRLRLRSARVQTLTSMSGSQVGKGGGIHLIMPACVLRASIGGISARQGRRAFRINANIQYQLQIRSPCPPETTSGTPLLHTSTQMRLRTLSFACHRDRQADKATVKSHGEWGFRARSLKTFNTLGRKDAREATIGAIEALANGSACFPWGARQKTGGGVGVGATPAARPIPHLSPSFAVRLFEIRRGFLPKKSGCL